MGIADYGRGRWTGVLFGIGTLPASWYLSLLIDSPASDSDGQDVRELEPGDAAYQRQPLRPNLDWALTEAGIIVNAAVIEFDTPTEDWGVITHYAIVDDAVDGELWFYERFAEAMVVPAGYAPSIGIGSITIQLGEQLAPIVAAT